MIAVIHPQRKIHSAVKMARMTASSWNSKWTLSLACFLNHYSSVRNFLHISRDCTCNRRCNYDSDGFFWFVLQCKQLLLAPSIIQEFGSIVLKSLHPASCIISCQVRLRSTQPVSEMSENTHLTNTTRNTFSQSRWKHNNNLGGYKRCDVPTW